MPTPASRTTQKGRRSLSIRQDLLDRLEPFKHRINLSAQTEQTLLRLIEELEHRDWAERNAEALAAHGRDIAATGLAGAEFERL